jgi:hypothetical protein
MSKFQVGDMVVLHPDFRPGGRPTMASLYIDCNTPQKIVAVQLINTTYTYQLENGAWLNESYLAIA